MSEYEPDEDQQIADLTQLQAYGSFGTALSIARRNNWTIAEVWLRPANEIYMILQYDMDEAAYSKRHHGVKQALARMEANKGR